MEGRGRDARERAGVGKGGIRRGEERRKVKTPPPSIPAYAPVLQVHTLISEL